MTTPTPKLTPLTDPDNVAWVIEVPPPGEVTAAARTRPKMTAYAALVAAAKVSLKKKFDESKVKRGPGGKFAKKAGSGPTKAAPSKKTAAAPPASGKKMTNKVVYGKHANGTIIESTDGQYRMVFNAAGNNWTFQRRTPDGGWEVIDVLGKGASYKKAQELSDSWGAPGAPDAGEPDTSAPDVATPTAPAGFGAFEPGWDDLSNVGIGSFAQKNLFTSLTNTNADAINPGAAALDVANTANQYGITPEQVLAIMDQRRGDTVYSNRVRAHLNGQPFPPPTMTVPPGTSVAELTKKAAAKKPTTKKIAGKKTAAPPTPTVAPAPTPAPPAKKAAAAYAPGESPMKQALKGNVDLKALERQRNDSDKVRAAYQAYVDTLSKSGASSDEVTAAAKEYQSAKKRYKQRYGDPWTVSHADLVDKSYQKALNAAGPVTPPPPTPATPPPASTPKTKSFAKGDAVTGPDGEQGVVIAVATTTGVNKTKLSKVKYPDGTSAWFSDAELEDATAAKPVSSSPPTPTSLEGAQDGIVPGATATLPSGVIVTVVDQAPPSGATPMINIQYPNGTTYPVAASRLKPLSASDMAESQAVMALGPNVMTPLGEGTVTGVFVTYTGQVAADVDVPGHGTVTFHAPQVTAIPAPPPPATVPHIPATPAAAPTLSYDSNGVPILNAAQQDALQAQFSGSGVNWYNDTTSIFDAAYAASQATGMSMEDVLAYADANFHKSSKFGGKPFSAKVEKWAKSSKGKAHIQSKLGAAPSTPTPATTSVPGGPTSTSTPPPPPMPTANATASSFGKSKQSDSRFFSLRSGYPSLLEVDAYELRDEMEHQFGPMSATEYGAIQHYTGQAYRSINECLRYDGDICNNTASYQDRSGDTHYSTWQDISAEASRGLRPLTQNVTLYRGVSDMSDIYANAGVSSAAELVGRDFHDRGFSSASISQDMAYEWAGDEVVMQLEIPEGISAMYVDDFSVHSGELEMLLQPGLNFRVTEYRPAPSAFEPAVIRVEVSAL